MVAAVGSHIPVVTIAGLNAQASRNQAILSGEVATHRQKGALYGTDNTSYQSGQISTTRDNINRVVNLHNDVAVGVGANGTSLGNHVNTYA
jgi:hypothetical protein